LMKVKVLLFGSIRDAADGKRDDFWELDEKSTTVTLLQNIVSEYPRIGFSTLAIAVNKKYITEPVELHEGDEVALLPPISGG
jgi:sulfur-carrier protein